MDESGSTALLVEARRLSQIDLRTGRRERVLDIPLAFNVCGITRVSADEIFLVDGGVHPHGRGRVLHGNLATGKATVVYSANTGLGDILYLPDRGTILVVAPLPWPSGEVLELDWSGGAATVKARWTGLDAPESMCAAAAPALALVGTHAGIVELTAI